MKAPTSLPRKRWVVQVTRHGESPRRTVTYVTAATEREARAAAIEQGFEKTHKARPKEDADE